MAFTECTGHPDFFRFVSGGHVVVAAAQVNDCPWEPSIRKKGVHQEPRYTPVAVRMNMLSAIST